MRPIFARRLLHEEREELNALLLHPVKALAKRAAIILLSSEERCRVSEISVLLGMHVSTIRCWIHRFNKGSMAALRPCEGWGCRVDSNVRETLVQLATTPPREIGLKFTTWTLRELRNHLVEQEFVQTISYETIRRILNDEKVDWRASRTLADDSLIPGLSELSHGE